MANIHEPSQDASSTDDSLTTWDDVRRMADEIELHVHLAGMNARDRWRELEPRLAALEQWFTRAGKRAGETVAKELAAVAALVRKLRADIANKN